MKILVEVQREYEERPENYRYKYKLAWLGAIFRATHDVAMATTEDKAMMDYEVIRLMATGLGFVLWLRSQ